MFAVAPDEATCRSEVIAGKTCSLGELAKRRGGIRSVDCYDNIPFAILGWECRADFRDGTRRGQRVGRSGNPGGSGVRRGAAHSGSRVRVERQAPTGEGHQILGPFPLVPAEHAQRPQGVPPAGRADRLAERKRQCQRLVVRAIEEPAAVWLPPAPWCNRA